MAVAGTWLKSPGTTLGGWLETILGEELGITSGKEHGIKLGTTLGHGIVDGRKEGTALVTTLGYILGDELRGVILKALGTALGLPL